MTTINSISPNIRDFLLSRNLILSSTIVDNGYASQAYGLGTPVEISTGNESVNDQPTVSESGELYRDLNLVKNPYRTENNLEIQITDYDSQNIGNLPPGSQPIEYGASNEINSELLENSSTYRDLNTVNNLYLDSSQQIIAELLCENPNLGNQLRSYIDENNDIRLANDTTNVLGAIINGRGVGVSNNGLEPNFDIRGSIAGRTLSAIGVINDTPIGIIGARELGFAIANNALFNAQEEINLNPIDLIGGGSLFNENYKITEPEDGQPLNIAQRILGFEVPVSRLPLEASIFQSENPVSSHLRNLNMIKNTGKGQYRSLFGNLSQSKFRPGYSIEGRNGEEGISDGNIYLGDIGNGEFIDLINDSNLNKVSKSSYDLSSFSDEFDSTDNGFNKVEGWSDNRFNKNTVLTPNEDILITNPKSLLSKTREIFRSDRMKSLTFGRFVNENPSQINSTIKTASGDVMSKGSGVISHSGDLLPETDPERMFCRTWTSQRKYDSIRDLQKNRGLDTYGGTRRNVGNSVLEDNGMPKIAPYSTDVISSNVKKFMFSIENLAWSDNTSDLAPCELGNGDLTTGTKGRIMWFPPYEMDFTDNTAINWDSTNFIGRGEPVYTYNNTERIGTLTFKIIADYASHMNDLKNINATNDLYASIVAGCTNFDDSVLKRLTPSEVTEINVNNNVKPEEIVVDKDISFEPISIYFSNDNASINEDYENGDDLGLGTTTGEGFTNVNGQTFEDETDFGLNKPFFDEQINKLKDFLRDECPACSIEIRGYASTQGRTEANQNLSSERGISVKNFFLDNIIEPNDPNRDKRIRFVIGEGETGPNLGQGNRRDSEAAKRARKVDVVIKYDSSLDETIQNIKPKEVDLEPNITLSNETVSRFIDECAYFEKMEQETPFLYERLTEKFKYFHPSFHSTTPEGLNSRLTFLQQCTRQGPTGNGLEQPNNLAFGKPPVCILRIGDFYHTKIVMDNLNFTYEPLVWDLNPEGVGVQPMIVTVDISFKFIGGSSLSGPINKLQNALSFNYFANTEIYDSRSDTLRPKTKDELQENPLGTHTLQDGTRSNEIGRLVDQSTEQGINNNPNVPPTDQIVRNESENSNSETTNINNRPKNDAEIIRSIKFSNVKLLTNGDLSYSYKSDLKFNENDSLSREYRVSYRLEDTTNQNVFVVDSGTLTIPTGNDNIIGSGFMNIFRDNSLVSEIIPNSLGGSNYDINNVLDFINNIQFVVKIGSETPKRYPINY